MPEVKTMKAKVLLLGDRSTKKTELIRPYVLDNFDDQYISTIGTKVSAKLVDLPAPEGSGSIRVDIRVWDITGQKGFRELGKEAYFRGANGILAVCDGRRLDTLRDTKDWTEVVYAVAGKVPTFYIIRTDDPNKVLEDEVLRLVTGRDTSFATLPSAATLEKQVVEGAFRWLAERIVGARYREDHPDHEHRWFFDVHLSLSNDSLGMGSRWLFHCQDCGMNGSSTWWPGVRNRKVQAEAESYLHTCVNCGTKFHDAHPFGEITIAREGREVPLCSTKCHAEAKERFRKEDLTKLIPSLEAMVTNATSEVARVLADERLRVIATDEDEPLRDLAREALRRARLARTKQP